MADQNTQKIPVGWKETKLGKVAIFNYGKGLKEEDRIEGDIPVYGSNGVTGWHNEPLISKKGIIIGRKGTIGLVNKSKIPFFPIDTVFYITEDDIKCDFEYLYYLLIYLKLYNLNTDSAVPGLNRNNAYAIDFLFPENNLEQCAIASVLSAFDDKIELLREQNKTLESIAQTIFKRWFVDFEFPNEQGMLYKSSGGKMIDSELGKIPDGWKVGTLRDEFEIIMGQSPEGESYNETGDGTIFFQGRTDFSFRFPSIRLYTNDPKKIAEKLDTLVSVRAPVGDINMAFDTCCIGRGLAAVRSKYKSYTYYKIRALRRMFENFESEGTVFGAMTRSGFENIEVFLPNKMTVKQFDEVIKPLDSKVFDNHQQIQTLSILRDTLLPKLMSGKLRVRF